MATPPNNNLQTMLQAAVQSVQWTYTIFWQFCPQQGILKWGDGYYNGAIKTRKTVQAVELSMEEASLQRSQQLKELFESLSVAETNPQNRRPSAALSPEDLTESEWFYLLCISFSFHPGDGLAGAAYARRQHLWLTSANQVDTQTFSRAILAKTVVCIPLLEGVVEFGTTDKVEDDLNFIQHVKSFFIDYRIPMPEPALSEQSASNPTCSFPTFATANISNQDDMNHDKQEAKLDSQPETVRNSFPPSKEQLDLDTLDDFRVGSPRDGPNQLDWYPEPEESTHVWAPVEEMAAAQQIQQPASVLVLSEEMAQGDTHYSQTVSTILQNQNNSASWWLDSPSVGHVTDSFQSAFTTWITVADDHLHHAAMDTITSQCVLKYILFSISHLHANHKGTLQKYSASGSHVLAERRRREKLSERFIILRSLVPFMTKTDKASILGDAIEYVKQLRDRVQILEARKRQMEADQRWRSNKKRKVREVEVELEVSIIESDVLLEVECMHREGLLVDVMKALRELGVEVMLVQSSVKDDGVFVAELRAKVKENEKGKKVSIVEVKKTLNKIIPDHHHPYSLDANGSRMCVNLECMQHFHGMSREDNNAHNFVSVGIVSNNAYSHMV
ncbi:hypothetical protein SESBI_06276 [Sesbania bispinosa]|nr:hypothetical protein SESBI_06276 [Sesbania bispinosa]